MMRRVLETLILNLLATTIYSVVEKAIPFQIWIAIIVNMAIIYYVLSISSNIYIKYSSAILVIAIFFYLATNLSTVFGFNSPLSNLESFRKYYYFKKSDAIDGGNASLLQPEIHNGILKLTIDRPEEIQNNHVYVNFGSIHKVEDEYWYLESIISEEFTNYINGQFSIPISKLSPTGDNFYIYLTNKPKENRWVEISNFNHPFFRKIQIGDKK